MNSQDDKKPGPILAVLFVVFLVVFFGGGLLLFINLFVPFLPEKAFAIIALGVGAMLVAGVIAGTCVQVITALRGVRDGISDSMRRRVSSMNRDEFYELWQFLGAYLHQDFDLHDGTADGAVEHFVKDASDSDIEQVVREIDIVLSKDLDDEQLSVLLSNLGCDYYPKGDGWETERAWLCHVRDKLQRSLTL